MLAAMPTFTAAGLRRLVVKRDALQPVAMALGTLYTAGWAALTRHRHRHQAERAARRQVWQQQA